MEGRVIVLYFSAATLSMLPESFRSNEAVYIKLLPVLFTQGIDIQQTMVTTFGESSGGRMKSADLQHFVNSSAFDMLNIYCFKCQPVVDGPAPRNDSSSDNNRRSSFVQTLPSDVRTSESFTPESTSRQSSTASEHGPSIPDASSSPPPSHKPAPTSSGSMPSSDRDLQLIHPVMHALYSILRSVSLTAKNVDLLLEIERICVMLGGTRVTFCKSGKSMIQNYLLSLFYC
jgi:hypothetical protein